MLQLTRNTTTRKRFRPVAPPHVPLLFLDEDGLVRHLTPTARRLLAFKEDDAIDPLFVSHVHGKNIRQISRDLDAMRRLGKQNAFWLTRIRTGRDRWAWFRIAAENRLKHQERAIVLRLRDLHD